MLFGGVRMLPTLGVIALAVMFLLRCGALCAKCYAGAGTFGCSGSASGGVSVGILSSSISLVTAEIELPTFSTIL
jgi:hypothetical protein